MTRATAARHLAGLVALALAAAPRVACAQSAFNPRDDRYRALGFERAHAEWRRADAEWRRGRALRELALLSEADQEERELARARARVDLLQQALAALDDAPHVMIERAVRRRRGVTTEVVLTFAGAPGEAVGARLLAALEPELRESLSLDRAGRVFVSLKSAPGAEGIVIATPYERTMRVPAAGARATLSFRLVRDAADVVVSLDHGGRIEERRILLEGDDGGAGVALHALQPAQEADLGAQASYDVALERLHERVDAVRVSLEGVPAAASAELRDGVTGARLSTVRFALGEREKRLRVVVTLPHDGGGGVRADSAMRLSVVAMPAGEASAARAAAGAARVDLELIPRGVARAELRLDRLFAEVRAGDSVVVAATVRSTGSRALVGARVRAEAPPGWEGRVEPAMLPALAVGAERGVRLVLLPGRGSGVGEYDARVRLEAAPGERALDGEPRSIRVRVRGQDGRGAGLWLVLLGLGALAVAAAWAGRRLLAR